MYCFISFQSFKELKVGQEVELPVKREISSMLFREAWILCAHKIAPICLRLWYSKQENIRINHNNLLFY